MNNIDVSSNGAVNVQASNQIKLKAKANSKFQPTVYQLTIKPDRLRSSIGTECSNSGCVFKWKVSPCKN